MSSLWKPPKRGWQLCYVDERKRRRFVSLGKRSKADAGKWQAMFDLLVEAKRLQRTVAPELSAWLDRIQPSERKRLVEWGLLQGEQDEVEAPYTLDECVEGYLEARPTITDRTRENLERSRVAMVSYFGEGRAVEKVTAADAEAFYNVMTREYAVATASKHFRNVRQFVTFGVRAGMVTSNPFAYFNPPAGNNKDRSVYVTRDVTEQVLKILPSAEWRLLFVLARYGGLRIPSEINGLTYGCLNEDEGVFKVQSPKVKRYGKGVRMVPLFPEVRAAIEERRREAEMPSDRDHMLPVLRTKANLGVLLKKRLAAAGIKPWPKPFHNLRASRITEVRAKVPAFVATAWMGNTEAVQNMHYGMVTSDDVKRAVDGNL